MHRFGSSSSKPMEHMEHDRAVFHACSNVFHAEMNTESAILSQKRGKTPRCSMCSMVLPQLLYMGIESLIQVTIGNAWNTWNTWNTAPHFTTTTTPFDAPEYRNRVVRAALIEAISTCRKAPKRDRHDGRNAPGATHDVTISGSTAENTAALLEPIDQENLPCLN